MCDPSGRPYRAAIGSWQLAFLACYCNISQLLSVWKLVKHDKYSWSCWIWPSYLPWEPDPLKTLKVHTRRQVAATCRVNASQQEAPSCTQENFCENFFSAKEFYRHKSHKFRLIWFSATCCGNKILWQRQRFSKKILQNTQNDLSLWSPQDDAATSCLTCTHTEWSVTRRVAATCFA